MTIKISTLFTENDKKEVIERFIRYAKVDTQSNRDYKSGDPQPSTKKQLNLAKLLFEELTALGVEARISDNGYVYATIPETAPTKDIVGLMSHIDVSPDAPSENVQPIIHTNITGEDLPLGGGTIISHTDLAKYKGQDIITSDGTTLLGADDKSGVASIMQLLTILHREKEKIPHGVLKICFTPDEEIGAGTDGIDLGPTGFNPKFAFTVDGSELGEIENESFSAKEAVVTIVGKEIHPGFGFGVLISPVRVMGHFLSLLPLDEAPETTKGRQGYLHPTDCTADSTGAKVRLILRDFDDNLLEGHVKKLEGIKDVLLQRFPGVQIEIKVRDQYSNMYNTLKDYPDLIKTLDVVCKEIEIEAINHPIRGGTDGCQLTAKGIPTPNIFAGGINFHSKREFIAVPTLYKVVEFLIQLVQKFVK